MSGKRHKRFRKHLRKNQKQIILDFLNTMELETFSVKLATAFKMLFPKIHKIFKG